MVVSKAHDETFRSTASHDDEATPAPTSEDIQSSKLVVAAANARRPRVGSAVPRERSGPIGIASGDFSTPSVRRRTTTQPRGTPVAGIPLSVPMVPPMAAPLTAPPEPAEPDAVEQENATPAPTATATPPVAETLPVGATPVDLVDGGLSGQAPGAPPPADSPFGVTPTDGEASALAAEAAAVRALDSGPLTPPPEVASVGPTPPPEPKAVLPPESRQAPPAASPEEMQLTPPPVVVAAATPPPLPTVDPVSAPAGGVEGALPVRAMGSEGSAASSDLANQNRSADPGARQRERGRSAWRRRAGGRGGRRGKPGG